MQVLQRVLADVLPRAVADHQQLRRRNHAAAVLRHQRLRHHRRQRHRQLLADGVLALRRKRVGDPADVVETSVVWRLENTRCPVSPAATAICIVSGSRISPTTMTVGRLAERGAQRVGKSGASMPISICSISDCGVRCSYSIGSSMVMMWRASRVVDLVDQRRERRRLAGAGRAADEDEPARQARRAPRRWRQVERREARHGGRQAADRAAARPRS
jgi:hypothetical protein